MSVSFVATGAWTASGTTSTGMTPPLPTGWAAGDMLLLFVNSKQSGADYQLNLISGWTFLENGIGGTSATYAAGAGNTVTSICYRVAQAGDTAPVIGAPIGGSTANTTGNVALGAVFAFRATTGLWATVISWALAQNTTATAWAPSNAVDASTDIKSGDFLVASTGISLSTTTVTSPVMTATGATVGASTVTPTKGASTVGADIGAHSFYAAVTAGTASAVPGLTETQSSTTYGSGMIVRLREALPGAPPVLQRNRLIRSNLVR